MKTPGSAARDCTAFKSTSFMAISLEIQKGVDDIPKPDMAERKGACETDVASLKRVVIMFTFAIPDNNERAGLLITFSKMDGSSRMASDLFPFCTLESRLGEIVPPWAVKSWDKSRKFSFHMSNKYFLNSGRVDEFGLMNDVTGL